MAKLTLNVDAETIEQAKHLAAEWNTSVSMMFSRFSRTLANRERRAKPVGRLACRASGVIDLEGRSHRNIVADALKDRSEL